MTSMARLIRSLTFSASLLGAGLAAAAPTVTYSGGAAVGIQDLVVGGVNYDVTFVFGSYDAVFASQAPTFLNNDTDANTAANALLAVLDAQAGTKIGDINDCCGIVWVPFADSYNGDSTLYRAKQTGYRDSAGDVWQRFGDFVDVKAADRTGSNWAFAIFTVDQSTVPEPGSLALVGAALAGLGLAARRRRHK